MTVRSLVIVRGSMAVTTMSVAAVRLNLNGMGVDDVLDLLVTSGLVIVSSVVGVIIALCVITVTGLVLAVVSVIVVVFYAPVKVVVGRVL